MRNSDGSCENDSLYGFRYDPVLKRYFKIGGEPVKQVSHVKSPRCPTSNINSKSNIVMKYGSGQAGCVSVPSIPQALKLREVGFTGHPSFSNGLIRMKLKQLKSLYNQKVSLTQEILHCDYIQGYQDYLVGAWAVDGEIHDLLIKGEYIDFDVTGSEVNVDSYFSDENCIIAKVHQRQKLSDLCVGELSSDSLCVAYVSNSIDPWVSSSYAACFSASKIVGPCDVIFIGRYAYYDASESCTFGNAQKLLAVGLERCIKIYPMDSLCERQISIPGRPFSINFSSDDNLLYCGLHNGTLLGIDLRAATHSPAAVHARPCRRGLLNFKLLRNQTTIVASAYDHMLLNVDLRSRKVVFHYPHHLNHCTRLLPLSYDETLNVLCSPGQDNVTRLWSLKEGKLLSSIQSPLGGLKQSLHKSWFHTTLRGPLLHLWQGDTAYLYST